MLIGVLIILLVSGMIGVVADSTTGQTSNGPTQTIDSCTSACIGIGGAVNSVYAGVSSCVDINGCELGQTFSVPTSSSFMLSQVQFQLKIAVGAPTGNVIAALYLLTGTYGSTAVPSGAALAISSAISTTTLTGSFQAVTFTFTGANQIILSPDRQYGISLRGASQTINDANAINVEDTSPVSVHPGNEYRLSNGGPYSPFSTRDAWFIATGFRVANPNIVGTPGFVPIIQLIPLTFGLLGLLAVYAVFEPRLRGGL